MRRLLVLISGTLLFITAASHAFGQPRDSVIIGLIGEPDHIVPGFSSLAVSGYVSSTLFVGLVGLNADWQLYPRVAREVPTLENGQWRLLPNNEMEVTYRIRSGFKWHDGTPVTAGDAIFAWEVLRDRRTGAAPPDPGISAMTAPDATPWSSAGAHVDTPPTWGTHFSPGIFWRPSSVRTRRQFVLEPSPPGR